MVFLFHLPLEIEKSFFYNIIYSSLII